MLRSVALLNFGTRRARRSLSVRCKSAHVTCKIQRSGRRYATWWIHISRVLNERSTAVLCAIAAQPSAAPQRRSIADRATAIYGVKRLPGEAACPPRPQIPQGVDCPKKEVFTSSWCIPLSRSKPSCRLCFAQRPRFTFALRAVGRVSFSSRRHARLPSRQNLLTRLLLCTVAQVVLLMLQCTVTVMPEFSWRHTMCGSHLYAMMMVCAHAP